MWNLNPIRSIGKVPYSSMHVLVKSSRTGCPNGANFFGRGFELRIVTQDTGLGNSCEIANIEFHIAMCNDSSIGFSEF